MKDTNTLTNVIALWHPDLLIRCCKQAGIDTTGRDPHQLAELLVRAIDEQTQRTRWMQ